MFAVSDIEHRDEITYYALSDIEVVEHEEKCQILWFLGNLSSRTSAPAPYDTCKSVEVMW